MHWKRADCISGPCRPGQSSRGERPSQEDGDLTWDWVHRLAFPKYPSGPPSKYYPTTHQSGTFSGPRKKHQLYCLCCCCLDLSCQLPNFLFLRREGGINWGLFGHVGASKKVVTSPNNINTTVSQPLHRLYQFMLFDHLKTINSMLLFMNISNIWKKTLGNTAIHQSCQFFCQRVFNFLVCLWVVLPLSLTRMNVFRGEASKRVWSRLTSTH